MADAVKSALQAHLERVRKLYDQDRAIGVAGVAMPDALGRKYPKAAEEWAWFWVFPSRQLSIDPRAGVVRRHHVVDGDIAKEKPSTRFNGLTPSFSTFRAQTPALSAAAPDARWRFSPERLRAACDKQAAILDAAAAYLEAGGRIVYGTCSLELEENDAQIDRWLCRHAEFKLADSRRLFPPESDTDGTYAALLIRK